MSTTAASSAIERAVATAVDRLDAGARRLAFSGPPTAGKSTAMETLRLRMSSKARVIHVELPRRGEDAAAVGMLSVAAQLDEALLDVVRNVDRPWPEKLDAVGDRLKKAEGVLLLVDEPRFPSNDPARSVFNRRAGELTNMLLSRAPRFVFANDSSAMAEVEEIILETKSDPDVVLRADRWNGLSAHAAALGEVDQATLQQYSPLELRLGVAAVAVGVDPAEIATRRWQPRRLVGSLVSKLSSGSRLQKVAGRLAVFRVPFEREALEEAGLGTLDSLGQDIVRSALLFGDGLNWKLHELIRAEALHLDWLEEGERTSAHETAARYHRRLFEVATRHADVASAVRHEAEMVHHLTEAGCVDQLAESHVYFVEQFDALGKSLSLKKRFSDAVTAYERALSHDDQDSYAHHYLAYNLDVPGKAPSRVDENYRSAVQLRPQHPLYQSRYILFLLTRGRSNEAREQWAEALARLMPGGPSEDEAIYRSLHCPIARLLLHRSNLAFAREVLEDAPPAVRARASWWRALKKLLVQLIEAQENQVVFPPSIAVEARWKGPHLVDHSDRAGVKRWCPGRIAAIEDGTIHIRIASRAPKTGVVEFGWRDFSANELRRLSPTVARGLSLPVGTFVEIVEFKKPRPSRKVILGHKLTQPEDSALPTLQLNPDRYIRAAAGTKA